MIISSLPEEISENASYALMIEQMGKKISEKERKNEEDDDESDGGRKKLKILGSLERGFEGERKLVGERRKEEIR